MGTQNHRVKTISPGLLWGTAFGLGVVTSCGGVSEDPLARKVGTGGRVGGGGATSAGAGGSSAGVVGAAGGGGRGGASGGQAEEEPPDGQGGLLTTPQAGAGHGGDLGDGGGASEGGSAGVGGVGGGIFGEGGTFGEGGRLGDGGTFGEGGGGSEGGSTGEGGSAGEDGKILTRCSSAAPFGTPQRVPGLPDGAVRLRLDRSETVGYYARFPPGSNADLEVTKRSSRSDAFSTGISLNMNDSGWDFTPTLPSDGSIMYFERRGSSLRWRIHQSVWDEGQQAFGPIDLVAGLGAGGSHGSDGAPYTLPSGEVLYFHSDRSGMGIMRAERVGTSFARVTTVPITFPPGLIFTTACPVVSPDELTIYFVAQDTPGRTDIWTATRSTAADSFGEAAPLVEVNTALGNEVPSFISEDGCRLYFDRNSNVPFGWTPPGNSFVAERVPDSE